MKKLLLIFVACFCSMLVFAQNNTIDVIYLKNGNIIRGTILEQIFGQSIKVKTTDGNVWVFLSQDVDKVVKENVATSNQPTHTEEVVTIPDQEQLQTQSQVQPEAQPQVVQPRIQYRSPAQMTYYDYVPRKDPAVACLLSVAVPGLGQIYNGQIGKGILFMAGTLGTLTLAAATCGHSYYDYYSNSYYNSNNNNGIAAASLVAMIGIYIWNIIDAPVSANKINRENGIVSINLKNSRLWLNPNIDYLRAQNGQSIPQTTNLGLKLTCSLGRN